MKVVQINTFPYKATGSIMMNLHRDIQSEGIDSYVVWGRGRTSENNHEILIEDKLGIKFHGIYTRVTDKTGFASKRATKTLLKDLEAINPDIIHLHNIHGYYINIEMLFDYIRANHIKVVWTLHDCWPFTGHCAYFDIIGCQKWKTGCYNCEQKHVYPTTKVFDNSKWNWQKKKALFTGLDITLVTPCNWLSKLVKQSYLKEYTVKVIYNGIDLNIFKPTISNFRKKYGLEDKFIILGVASEWSERKGLKDFIRLGEMLNDKFKIIIVGLTKQQSKSMTDTIMTMCRTSNVQELVEIYSAADIFFNPTYEDNFPTTNLEALACGTPVCTYRTGGSSESLNESCGLVLEQGDVETFSSIIYDKLYSNNMLSVDCIDNTKGYSKVRMISQYIELYKELYYSKKG